MNERFREIRPDFAAHLFSGWEETIIWSCLQDVMGCIYGNSAKSPTSAVALLGDFGFLAGVADAEFLLQLKSGVCKRDFLILVPQNEPWEGVIKTCYGERCRKVTRYAFKKEAEGFDIPGLKGLVNSLPKEYRLVMINQHWYSYCGQTSWCKDFVSQYESYEQYAKSGLGVLILKDGIPISGASSYSAYRSGIEVEIDTREDYRRKGLATACGAKLILECLKRNLYPSWDAQNLWSAALAGKLGYRFSHKYTAYEVFSNLNNLASDNGH